MRVAAYARYSSDSQREASIDDQLRNCRVYCERHGWPEPIVYADKAISGSRQDRADYQRLLNDMRRFDVLLVDDLSRFGRDKGEIDRIVKRLVFEGVRLIGVSDGVDTARKSHKADVGLRGLMSEMYLDDLAEKTHRGQTGRALAGASAGGLPYGYIKTDVGQRAQQPAEAVIVRRIFADYIAGESPRTIAAALNAEGVPSPRGSTWGASAIHGDTRRGIGILANPVYAGRQVWNRSHWVKHPDTGRRVRQERPPAEWITTEVPELAIIDDATWRAAQARLQGNRNLTVTASKAATKSAGRPPRYLLSGILRCAECGGPMVIVDRYRYGCSTHKERGDSVCPSRLRVPRKDVEHAVLAGVRSQLLSEDLFQRFQRSAAEALKTSAPDIEAAAARLMAAERVHENILAALRAGIITPSTRAELLNAESEVNAARANVKAMREFEPAKMLPRARDAWREMVDTLSDCARDVPVARTALREFIGENAKLVNEEGAIFCEIAPSIPMQINLVAGARSALYLTEPLRIPITIKPGRES